MLFNPVVYPQELGITADNEQKVRVIVGEFFESDAAQAWQKILKLETINNAGEYLPNWAEVLLQKQSLQQAN
jgi:hypothetical protein